MRLWPEYLLHFIFYQIMSKKNCANIDSVDTDIREYKQSGAIHSDDTNAILFYNKGTSTALINGFPLTSGQSLSIGNNQCSQDCTKYVLSFQNDGTQINSLFVVRGENLVQLSNIILPGSSGIHSKVDIYDSSGAVLNSTSGQLQVVDTGVIAGLSIIATDITTFATQNHTDLGTISTNITTFAAANHTDTIAVTAAVNNFAAINHSDLLAIATDITVFAAANHTDLGTVSSNITTFAAANHTDTIAVTAAVNAFASTNHTDEAAILAAITAQKADLDIMAGAGGFQMQSAGDAAFSGNGKAIVVNARCIFTTFKINGVDKIATKKMTGVTIEAGIYLTPDPGLTFTDLAVSSGSIVIYF